MVSDWLHVMDITYLVAASEHGVGSIKSSALLHMASHAWIVKQQVSGRCCETFRGSTWYFACSTV